VTLEVEALMRNVREQSEKILALRGELNPESPRSSRMSVIRKLADLVASNLRLKSKTPISLEIWSGGKAERVNDCCRGSWSFRRCRPNPV